MKKLGVVALVVVGLIVLAQALPFLSSLAWSIEMVANGETALGLVQLAWSLTIVAAMLAAATYLIRNRVRIADRWFDEGDMPHSLTEHGVLRVALVVIGVFLVTKAIPELVGGLGGFAIQRVQGGDLQSTYDLVLSLLIAAIELGLGIYLVRRNGTLADRIWNSPTAENAAAPAGRRLICPQCGASYDSDDYSDIESARCVECHAPLSQGDV